MHSRGCVRIFAGSVDSLSRKRQLNPFHIAAGSSVGDSPRKTLCLPSASARRTISCRQTGVSPKRNSCNYWPIRGEVWMSPCSFTLQPMFDELLKADGRGVKIHLLLDHRQEAGRAEATKVKNLTANLKHGDVTITTAGINSRASSQIWHWKGFVVRPAGSDQYACWEGSTNFSQSGWLQGNSARTFASTIWAHKFIQIFRPTSNGPWPTNRNTRFTRAISKQL
jgi:hypothetical protein